MQRGKPSRDSLSGSAPVTRQPRDASARLREEAEQGPGRCPGGGRGLDAAPGQEGWSPWRLRVFLLEGLWPGVRSVSLRMPGARGAPGLRRRRPVPARAEQGLQLRVVSHFTADELGAAVPLQPAACLPKGL